MACKNCPTFPPLAPDRATKIGLALRAHHSNVGHVWAVFGVAEGVGALLVLAHPLPLLWQWVAWIVLAGAGTVMLNTGIHLMQRAGDFEWELQERALMLAMHVCERPQQPIAPKEERLPRPPRRRIDY